MRAEHRELADLAASVADGTPVDWNAVERGSAPLDRRLVSHLRLVESIAALHRSIPADDLHDVAAFDARAARDLPTATAAGPHWGRLSLLDRIGEGTSCEVYRAWDTSLHREVALKLFHQEDGSLDAQERVLSEARRMARIRHQHVVQVYGAEQHDGRLGLWMELVRGESLEQAVKTHGTCGPREAALIGLDLSSALAAVHAAGLLHRDIKAQNVMREERGRIVLMDFGTGEELAGSNRLIGTPLYLAPELFRGQRASVQSDIYSLGVLLFYLVTAKFPVIAGTMEQLAHAHAQRQRQPLRDLRPDAPETFVRAIERALDSDPTRRFQSVGDFEAALRESIDHASVPLIAPPVTGPAQSPARRRHFGLAFGLATAALLAVIAGLIVWTGGPAGVGVSNVSSLAVLPLVDKSVSPSPELADAMTERMIATIGQIDSIRTTSITSTLPFKGSDRPRTEIAKELGVDAVMEGFITAIDDGKGTGRVRLQAQVVRAGTGATLWSGSAIRNRGDVASLLSEIARRMTSALHAAVTPDEANRLRQSRRTSPIAEEAYFQGRLHLAGYGRQEAERALASFERAVAADSSFAPAHASQALAYVKLAGFGGMSHSEARLLARAALRRAGEIEPDIAELHAGEADLKFLYDWDWAGAEQELLRSIELNPGFLYSRNLYAQLLATQGRFDEMLRFSDETLQQDPQSVYALVNHGQLLYYKRDWAAADDVAQRALALKPGDESALLLRARVLEAQGRYDEALTLVGEAKRLSVNPGVTLQIVEVRLQALAGKLDVARAAAHDLEEAGKNGTLRVRPRDLAYLYLAFGRTSDALDQFERALDERDPSLVWLQVNPRSDPVKQEPRFQAILRAVGIN